MRRVAFALAAGGALSLGLAQFASAADKAVPYKAPAPAYSWTGCYVGAVVGYQTGRSHQAYGGLVNGVPNNFLPFGTDLAGTYEVNGPQLGGTLGCNYQVGHFVIGVEGDWSQVMAYGERLSHPAAVALGLNSLFEFSTQQHWMATARGRLGYAVDRWLLYVTGGAVWGRFSLNNQNSTLVATATRVPSGVTAAGWIGGLGVEYATFNAVTIKLEGLLADYQTMHYGDEPGILNGCTAGCANADVSMRAWMVRFGINYRFFGGGN